MLMLTTKEVKKEAVIGTRLTIEIQKLVEQIAKIQGLKPSEYLRNLILEDLEKRSLISTKIENLKENMRNGPS